MLIVCPACASSYRIAPEALGAGRMVRCARCRTEWFVASDVEDAVWSPAEEPVFDDARSPIQALDDDDVIDALDAAPEEAEPAAVAAALGQEGRRREATTPQLRARSVSRLRKLRPAAVVAALGSAVLVAGFAARADVVRHAPATGSLFAFAGFPVNVRGLEISALTSVEEIEDGVPVLMVTGLVSNVTAEAIEPPRLRLAVLAGDDREIYAWTTVLGRPSLKGGEAAPFRSRLASPPAEGRRIQVRFLARRDLLQTK
ncbi:zinc-ribbon domain-containing protein [Methylopila turkensis]|uniref:Thioredoxin n=1 Tax=Methylopila turkensis TaxID=1437816 RepID=A0A9W6N6G9_9HYPH|nr:zinc-ribbon domain-containing protein [Methylopila turkensis]GLK80229.1 thioredoxin [Methylopila turkensis]